MVHFAPDGRPMPEPTPVSMPFFEGLAQEVLLLPCCPRDSFFFYPRNRCPTCLQADWAWKQASGRGRVYSVTVDRVGHDPGLKGYLPLVIAVVELVEGPRMVANIVGSPPEDVRVGSAVRAHFTRHDGRPLLHFELV
jgi:uncharacterized OB-fold protein